MESQRSWYLIPLRPCWPCWALPWCCQRAVQPRPPSRPRSPPSLCWAPSSACTSTTCSPSPPATTAAPCSASQAGLPTLLPGPSSVSGPTTTSWTPLVSCFPIVRILLFRDQTASSGWWKEYSTNCTASHENVAMNETFDWNPWRSRAGLILHLPTNVFQQMCVISLLTTNIYLNPLSQCRTPLLLGFQLLVLNEDDCLVRPLTQRQVFRVFPSCVHNLYNTCAYHSRPDETVLVLILQQV